MGWAEWLTPTFMKSGNVTFLIMSTPVANFLHQVTPPTVEEVVNHENSTSTVHIQHGAISSSSTSHMVAKSRTTPSHQKCNQAFSSVNMD
jgi:hypothetical protein